MNKSTAASPNVPDVVEHLGLAGQDVIIDEPEEGMSASETES